MDSIVGNLEDKMNDGFKNEAIQRKKGYKNLEEEMRKECRNRKRQNGTRFQG